MTQMTGPQIVSELRQQLQSQSGRHLYAVLGTYRLLDDFEKNDLTHALSAEGQPLPAPVNFNLKLLDQIEDESLRKMVRDESRHPLFVKSQLNQAFEKVLREHYAAQPLLVLKSIELMFAYQLDLSKLRTFATDRNHLLLLLPGRLVSDQILLFHETGPRFQAQFPGQLVTKNNLWELKA